VDLRQPASDLETSRLAVSVAVRTARLVRIAAVLATILPIVFLPFIVFMGIRTAQEQGIDVVLFYFLLFLAAHLIIAAVGILLMRETWRHLWMVPVYRIVCESLRAYLLYTAAYMAVRGVRTGWKKLARTGTLDTGLLTAHEESPITAGAAER
jgi:hypothetical protein